MFPAWAGNICLIFWSDATLFQIKFGPSLVLLGGEVQYCSQTNTCNNQINYTQLKLLLENVIYYTYSAEKPFANVKYPSGNM